MDEYLKAFEVRCGGDETIFWRKLCLETGWSQPFAEEAFLEYKKFIWLAKVSGTRVVPSVVVDKVWHVHLTFTKSYWHELCGDVLGFEFHHTPSRDGIEWRKRDRDGYEKTLLLYRKEFGVEPEPRYWPVESHIGFSVAKHSKFLSWGVGSAFLLTFLTACSVSSDSELMFWLKWGVGLYVGYKVLKWLSKGGGSGRGGGGGCSSCSSCGGD